MRKCQEKKLAGAEGPRVKAFPDVSSISLGSGRH